MNRTIKEATVRSFPNATLSELGDYLKDYLWTYNRARPLRALKGKAPIGLSSNVGKIIQDDFINIPGLTSRGHTPSSFTSPLAKR